MMRQIRRTLRENFDKLISDCLFIAFGFAALFSRPRSQDTQTEAIAIIFDIQFILIGSLLLVGILIGNYRLKVLGFTLYAICLSSLGFLILAVSHSVVGLLVLAFAIRGYSSIREMRIHRKFIVELAHALERPGDNDGHQ